MNLTLPVAALIVTSFIFSEASAEGTFSAPYSGDEKQADELHVPPAQRSEMPPGRGLGLKALPAIPKDQSQTPPREKIIDGFGTVSHGSDGSNEEAPAPDVVKDAITKGGASFKIPEKIWDPKERTVFGADERIEITTTTGYPFRTFGLVFIGYPDGSGGHCSGTLVGKRYVLTAAHCLYDAKTGNWASSIEFYPGVYNNYAPYGKFPAQKWFVPKGYITVEGNGYSWERMHYDIGLIRLGKEVGSALGWLAYGYDNSLPVFDANIVGYPGDKPAGSMWRTWCNVDPADLSPDFFQNRCDITPGSSGSSTYDYEPSDKSRLILGVLIAESNDWNTSIRLNEVYFKWLQNLAK